jgi:uncharacterized phage-associated protein
MERINFIFDQRKSTQVLNYFAIKAGGQINKMKALKLVFFADRYHLRKYGRLITNDNYVAMQQGPVPSATKDIAEANDYLDDATKSYSQEFVRPSGNWKLKSVNEVDESILSESDLEALQFAWDTFGHLTQFQLRDVTHSYPEWARLKDILVVGSCVEMNLFDFLKDPPPGFDKCFEVNKEDKSLIKEQLAELAKAESLWR